MDSRHLGMDPEQVHTAGHQVANQSTDASGLASRYLSQLALAAGGLHHVRVTAAVSRIRDAWQPLVNDVSPSIDELGNNTGAAAVTVALSDNDSTALLGQQTAASELQASVLSRNPNAATPI